MEGGALHNQGRCSFKESKGTKVGIHYRWSPGSGPSLFLSLYLDGRRKYNNTPPGEGAGPQSQDEDETDGSDTPCPLFSP